MGLLDRISDMKRKVTLIEKEYLPRDAKFKFSGRILYYTVEDGPDFVKYFLQFSELREGLKNHRSLLCEFDYSKHSLYHHLELEHEFGRLENSREFIEVSGKYDEESMIFNVSFLETRILRAFSDSMSYK